MEGIQKTIYLGLLTIAKNVKAGKYGIDDDAFGGDEDELGLSFLDDMCDEVTSIIGDT